MNFRLIKPEALIDSTAVPASITSGRRTAAVIGPMTTQSTVEYSDLVKSSCPLISKTMIYLGSPTIRNRGTIGGTLAHADRTAELPAVAVALEAELIAQSKGSPHIPAESFFRGELSTDLRTDEMLRNSFPVSPNGSLNAFTEVTPAPRSRPRRRCGASSACRQGTVARGRIVCIGIAPSPIRLKRVEQTLCGTARMRTSSAMRRSSVSTGSSQKATSIPVPITAAPYCRVWWCAHSNKPSPRNRGCRERRNIFVRIQWTGARSSAGSRRANCWRISCAAN